MKRICKWLSVPTAALPRNIFCEFRIDSNRDCKGLEDTIGLTIDPIECCALEFRPSEEINHSVYSPRRKFGFC